ncbi:MAG: hypothetical protein R6V56_02195 [Lentisphaeria bacterium]
MARKKRKQRSGFFRALIIHLSHLLLVVVLLGVVGVALDRVGPYKGWVDRVVAMATDKGDEDADQGVGQQDSADDYAGQPEEALEPAAKTDKEQLYENLKQEYLEKLPKPRLGEVYPYRLNSGEVIRGKLKERSDASLKIEVPEGEMVLPSYALAPQHRDRYFPGSLAKKLALRDIEQGVSESSPAPDTAKKAEDSSPSRFTDKVAENDQETGSDTVDELLGKRGSGNPGIIDAEPEDLHEKSGKQVQIAITPPESDPELKPLLEQFGSWMEYQNRRAGISIAEAAYAKQQGQACVLYLVLADSFKAQPYDKRFQLAEAFWKFWAFRAQRRGAIDALADAYIVLLDENRNVLGGSKPTDGSEIMVEK